MNGNWENMNGNWTLTGDYLLDGKLAQNSEVFELNLTSVTPDHFTGTYVIPADNDSQFDGHTYTSPRGTVITIEQFDPLTSYFATYAACAKDGVLIGAWFDVDGKGGDFTLERKA